MGIRRRAGKGARGLVAVAGLAAACIAAAASIASGQAATSWPSLQGGPQHLAAFAGSALSPPLRSLPRAPTIGDPRLSAVAVTQPATADTAQASPTAGIAVATGVARFVRFDPVTGDTLWETARAEGFLDAPAIDESAGEEGVVVATEGMTGSFPGVVGLDLTTGAQLWRFGLKQVARGAPSIAGGTAFVGGSDAVYAFGVSDGHVLWKAPTSAPVTSSPAVADGRVFAVAEDRTSGRATVYALDAASGKTLWTFAPSAASDRDTSPTVANGFVYVGFGDDTVKAFDAATGTVRWTQPVRAPFSSFSTAAYSDGDLYVMDVGGGVYRFDGATGAKAWDYQFDTTSRRGAPLVTDRAVYVGLDDGSVAALDRATGDLVWSSNLHRGILEALSPAGDLLLAPSIGVHGGVTAFRHDPDGALVRVESPTRLHLAVALAGYGVAFVLVMAAVLGLFSIVTRRQRRDGGAR